MRLSTFSIAAHDPVEQSWGIAVASKFLAVGSVVPWAIAGVGAVATQSYANTAFGPNGLELMAQGASAQQALEALLADDTQREQRQVGLMDSQGGAATFTGSACHDWAGGLTVSGAAIQGNILAGEQVIASMAQAFQGTTGSLAHRLLVALLAGDRAGGDKRGRQSAALLVVKSGAGYGGFNDRWIDYRVDDHDDPVARLDEIMKLHDLYFGKSDPDERISLAGTALQRLQTLMNRLGYYAGAAHGVYDEATRQALTSFIGNENFEERTDFEQGKMDLPVYEHLLQVFKG